LLVYSIILHNIVIMHGNSFLKVTVLSTNCIVIKKIKSFFSIWTQKCNDLWEYYAFIQLPILLLKEH